MNSIAFQIITIQYNAMFNVQWQNIYHILVSLFIMRWGEIFDAFNFIFYEENKTRLKIIIVELCRQDASRMGSFIKNSSWWNTFLLRSTWRNIISISWKIKCKSHIHSSPGVTVMLSLTVFMNIVSELMPITSDAVPLIGQKQSFEMSPQKILFQGLTSTSSWAWWRAACCWLCWCSTTTTGTRTPTTCPHGWVIICWGWGG